MVLGKGLLTPSSEKTNWAWVGEGGWGKVKPNMKQLFAFHLPKIHFLTMEFLSCRDGKVQGSRITEE